MAVDAAARSQVPAARRRGTKRLPDEASRPPLPPARLAAHGRNDRGRCARKTLYCASRLVQVEGKLLQTGRCKGCAASFTVTELARGTPRGKAMRVLCLVAALLLVHAAFCQAESRTHIQLLPEDLESFNPPEGVEPSFTNIQTAQAYARERGK
eukprot:CAMPEP_0198241266 /NCGR_PEP_ID=MMETSP1446-20131203/6115_1 /TAXON_ID=1461542 ORGANISM="Unidentified sp, Strain CCMP2111" /NCGR_SAMPLE_ID=MMETSP1446 /ASSEMBLY_ACC=CAM_ASM_001112 /LENGTH=153 /DNA_ID=CAMNT_0043924073 /DNA_START=74 /DNA_END=533 /DNA_ORIENTATION=+